MRKPTTLMIRLRILTVVACATAALAGPAGAITNGTPDGTLHPYVGLAADGQPNSPFCSGTLLSPRVFLTAGHCTAAFGATAFVTLDPNGSSGYVSGTPCTEPGFFNVAPQGLGVPASVGNDLGVIVLDQPVDLTAYGQLPGLGTLDGQTGTAVTGVGYGAQGVMPAPGGRTPVFTFVRTYAQAHLINDTNANGGQFVRISTNPGRGQGGIGPGDSGGPALLDGSSTTAAIVSHGPSKFGTGTAYFTRLDTPDALNFITPFLSGGQPPCLQGP
jgi:secreted trypsin-like serine protease